MIGGWLLRCCLIAAVLDQTEPRRQLAAIGAPSPQHAIAGVEGCRFNVPEDWSRFKLKWDGGCAGGKASGRGALKAFEKARVDRIFFGCMEKGELVIGVVDTADGFVAGKFEHGRVVETDERSIILRSFEEASAAAKAVSDRFSRAGNAASARFYDEKAKKLAEQMD